MHPTGLLLVNLGSPEAPNARAVRRFLDEFLGDEMVVDANRVVWWMVRKCIILPRRSPAVAELYREIWTADGSPLVARSRAFADAVSRATDAPVELAMRYGEMTIRDGMERLRARGCRDVHVAPMFPQESRTTTGSIEKAARDAWSALGADGDVTFEPPYFDAPPFIDALARSVRETVDLDAIDHLVISLHGLPVRYVEAGDPYRDHCEATAAALARELALDDDAWSLTYQSRFGREPWLLPDTADEVVARGRRGERVAIVCPGFAVDCLETLEEIDSRLRADFTAAGGPELIYVPCLDDDAAWARAFAERITRTAGARRSALR